MIAVVELLTLLGVLGAVDTLYFHEWRAKLPGLGKHARAELQLHAARDFIYALLFSTLPWIRWQGNWAVVLALLLLAEVMLTLWDFVVEDWIRKPLGGVYPAERIMHGVMGIVYGAMLAYLIPSLHVRWLSSTNLTVSAVAVPSAFRWAMLAMAAGVLASGVRDICASFEIRGSAWPWIRPTSLQV